MQFDQLSNEPNSWSVVRSCEFSLPIPYHFARGWVPACLIRNAADWLSITPARRRPRESGDPYSRGGGYGSLLSRGRQ